MSSGGGPGVVERASKEISRRIHSLGFKSSSSKRTKSVDTDPSHPTGSDSISASTTAAVDKLNGNEVLADGSPNASCPQPGPASPGMSSKMGTIIKGSVMDKVTHVFGSAGMGNSNNKEKQAAAAAAAAAASADSGAKGAAPSNGGAAADAKDNAAQGGPSGSINIPKGAVANGRAKFEANTQKNASPEKPMRFFTSRSRTNSPLLPVKTPKVPGTTNGKEAAQTVAANPGGLVSGTPVLGKKKPGLTTTQAQGGKKTLTVVSPTAPSGGKSLQISPVSTAKLFPKMKRFILWEEMWMDYKFLVRFFWYFTYQERYVLAQICKRWREVLYQPCFWNELRPVLQCRALRTWTDNEPLHRESKLNYFTSLKLRGFETMILQHANDADVFDFIQNFPHGAKHVYGLILRCCNLSDRGLEALMEFLQGLYQLEICGCNEITEQGLWSSLHPRLISMTINDCINVADECICAVTQLLPALYEFNLQAYHVTDSALSYFSPKQTGTLNVLRLHSCWEITNHGVVNIVHTLPNLTVLSLSGCSKITDDGIELIAENLRKLRSLDVSWCPRVTDAALEYIACDLNHLEELTLDRCVHITDIGIGYISTMLALHTLYLRWCTQIRDFGLQHICGMRSMQILSLAGCPLLTSSGLSNLVQLRHLSELELTNCPGATTELIEYLRQNLPNALVLD
eukprot:maker-scaffold38_size502422-snap-gene-2.17 protein:Tk05870 transcript:maker-scaffold38_size502422-snap-gene-2.17-mRNA-1 annotation:"f-box lrr-repeat protein 16"